MHGYLKELKRFSVFYLKNNQRLTDIRGCKYQAPVFLQDEKGLRELFWDGQTDHGWVSMAFIDLDQQPDKGPTRFMIFLID